MTNQDNQNISMGFITQEAEEISIDDVEQMFAFISERHEDPGVISEYLCSLARECLECDRMDSAYAYLEKALTVADAPAERARCLLYMGLVQEQTLQCAAAIETYQRAFALPQEVDETWYFLNNNLGYCLNQEGRFIEAEGHCLAAVGINPERHNAYKNLGVALQGIGRYVEAARNFIKAMRICPSDTRALNHLERLLLEHPEIHEQDGDILAQLMECQAALKPSEADTSVQ